MRRKAFSIATLFVAAAISVAVVSCQKDNETETENQVMTQSANDSRELFNRIYAFQELRDNINAGEKSNGSMSLQEMRDNIDLTFNFEHSQHATPFDYATLDTFYVKMPNVDANGNVSEVDVIATYNAFETNLEKLMMSVDDDMNMTKNFSIKLPETGAKNGGDIEVVFTLGNGDPFSSVHPFEEDDDYIWGLMQGRCDHALSIRTDAANELTKKFQFSVDEEHEGDLISISKIEYVKYKPYNDNDHYFPDYIFYEDTTITNGLRWLYVYAGDCTKEPCIEDDEMNFYHESIIRNVVSPSGPLHFGLKSGYPYHECIIEATAENILYKDDNVKRDVREHTIVISYCQLEYGNYEQ